MLGVLALAAALAAPGPRLDPQHLPPLPPQGLVRQLRAGVALETMSGRPLGWLSDLGFATAPGQHGALLEDRRRRLFVIDRFERRVREVFSMNVHAPRGCRFSDATQAQLFVCGRVLKTRAGGRTQTVARAPASHGSWRWAEFSRDRPAILAQWSGECESPMAFLIVGGTLWPYGGTTIRNAPESFALGWLPGGRAVVYFPSGACGSGHAPPGVYVVPLRRRPQLLLRVPTSPPQLLEMWGG